MTAVVQTPTTLLALANAAQRGNLRAVGDALRSLAVGEPYVTYAGNPNSNVTPAAIGQIAFDSTNLVFYKATALTNTSWGAISSAPSGLGLAGNLAATGSAQGNAAAIVTRFVNVTAADATKGVKLPTAVAGTLIYIKNGDAANAVLKVWPSGNATINAVAAAGNLSMAAKTSAALFCVVGGDSGTWFSTPLLPS